MHVIGGLRRKGSIPQAHPDGVVADIDSASSFQGEMERIKQCYLDRAQYCHKTK